jgi:hypothetical protein
MSFALSSQDEATISGGANEKGWSVFHVSPLLTLKRHVRDFRKASSSPHISGGFT